MNTSPSSTFPADTSASLASIDLTIPDRAADSCLRAGSSRAASAMPLSWGNAEETESVLSILLDRAVVDENNGTPPLIVAADCVYWESLFDILVDTLCLVCHRTGARVLMSHIRRWKKDAKFFKLCAKKGLNVDLLSETVEHEPAEHTGIPERIVSRVYLITLKK